MDARGRALRWLNPGRMRRSISARVMGGFLITIALAAAVALISLAYNVNAGRDLAQVTQRDRAITANLRDLEVAVEQQTGAVQNFLLSGDERDLDALSAARARFAAAIAALDTRLPPEQRGETWAEIQRRAQALDDIATEEIALYRQGWGRSANFLWRTEGVETKGALLASVMRQQGAHDAAVDANISGSRRHLRLGFIIAVALVSLAAALAAMVGLSVSRAVKRPVRTLIKLTESVGAGDYSVRAPVHGQDELAVLSASVNTMVESLAQSRARLELALAETERSEAQYRLLAENANDVIFSLDGAYNISFINPAVERTLGYRPEELIGTPALDLFANRTDETAVEMGVWTTQPPYTYTGVVELIARDGRIVPMEINSSVMRVGGRLAGIQGIARDMTERYRMEQELRRLHQQDRRRVDQLTTVNEVGRQIAALRPVDEMLPQLVGMLVNTFGFHYVRILLVDDDGGLETAASFGAATADEEASDASTLAARALLGDAGFVAGSGRPEDADAIRYTEVAVPVRTKSGVLGVLDIRDTVDAGLDESDIFTLQTLADQIAVAIENARLFEAGQQLAVSEERNRLARELHDSVTQELFSMTMISEALPLLLERRPDKAQERLQRLHELSRGALVEMRALLFALRPAALAEEGLIAALQKHAAAVESRESIPVHLEIDGGGRLPQPCEEALYRVFQEALNNVVKHAHASSVWVRLEIGDEQTSLTVRDDGAGFTLAPPMLAMPTMGLTSMRERVEAFGGEFEIESAPGEGTTVSVTIPVACLEPTPAEPSRAAG